MALTVADSRGAVDIWVFDSRREALSRLTSDSVMTGGFSNAGAPLWSRDGRYVVFPSIASRIRQARADGSMPPQVLIASKANQYPTSFSPDGKRLAYWDSAGAGQIFTVPIEDDGRQLKAGTPEPFLTDTFTFRAPSFSPDGRWLAYHSIETGSNEVFVRAFPAPASGAGGRWQVSIGGGTEPRWSPAGDTLFYRSGNQIVAVPYSAKGEAFVADKPRPWITNLGGALWDLSPDGTRVAVMRPEQGPAESKPEHVIVFVQNFFDELRRRAPLPR